MRKLFAILALGCSLCMVACSSGGKTVTRVDEISTTDLSGKWNDTDSRLVADEMISGCLGSTKIEKVIGEMGRTPTVVIGKVRNKSHEHISVETFIKDMERALLNSGAVDFVANSAERAELREEVRDQQGNATEETSKELHHLHVRDADRHHQHHRGPGRRPVRYLLPGGPGTHRFAEPQEALDGRQEDQEVHL